jgi:hypothetical protein
MIPDPAVQTLFNDSKTETPAVEISLSNSLAFWPMTT